MPWLLGKLPRQRRLTRPRRQWGCNRSGWFQTSDHQKIQYAIGGNFVSITAHIVSVSVAFAAAPAVASRSLAYGTSTWHSQLCTVLYPVYSFGMKWAERQSPEFHEQAEKAQVPTSRSAFLFHQPSLYHLRGPTRSVAIQGPTLSVATPSCHLQLNWAHSGDFLGLCSLGRCFPCSSCAW